MADREITWSLATQYKNGIYQGTFRFDVIQLALNHMAQYFQVKFRRTTRGGSILVLQSNKAPRDPNWAAWTIGNTIYISPVYNYKKSASLTAKVILHELGHIGNGTSHANNREALMHGETGTSGGWVQDDLRWFGKYKLRSSLPPVGSIRNTFSIMDAPMTTQGLIVNQDVDINIKCGHENTFWDRIKNYYDILTANYTQQY